MHDLTLLKISVNHNTNVGDHVTLCPAFGLKKDGLTYYRQLGWKLLKRNNNNICPVFWLRKVIKLGGPRRTAACGSSLFTGNWIKTVLRDAGNCSVSWVCALGRRVASLNWYEIFPIEDILSRGNWRSKNTFARYYGKQILGRNPTQNNLSVNLVPI